MRQDRIFVAGAVLLALASFAGPASAMPDDMSEACVKIYQQYDADAGRPKYFALSTNHQQCGYEVADPPITRSSRKNSKRKALGFCKLEDGIGCKIIEGQEN